MIKEKICFYNTRLNLTMLFYEDQKSLILFLLLISIELISCKTIVKFIFTCNQTPKNYSYDINCSSQVFKYFFFITFMASDLRDESSGKKKMYFHS